MRPACSRRASRGTSLLELLVACFIMSLISLGGFKLLVDGSQYLRLQQQAIDAQRSGLAMLSQVCSGLQTTRNDLVKVDARGVVFASPFSDTGSVEFEASSQKLKWQRWVCYYYDASARRVTRRERDVAVVSDSPGTPPAPSSFAASPVAKLVGEDVARFQVTSKTTTPPVWSVDVTVGEMDDVSRYGIEVHSDVSPRN